ncbi:MAG TPA: hypothetical protein VGT00_19630 [Methylomirabilota bacterium]|nr:hypothetical protein [Methylomirabilota bacterium]
MSGHVTVSRGAPDKVGTLAFKDAVFDRDRIGTGERSSARLLLGGKAVVTVRELSSLAIADQAGLASLHLAGGTVALAVARRRMHAEERVELHLPGARASTRGAVLIAEASRTTDPWSRPFTSSRAALTLLTVAARCCSPAIRASPSRTG